MPFSGDVPLPAGPRNAGQSLPVSLAAGVAGAAAGAFGGGGGSVGRPPQPAGAKRISNIVEKRMVLLPRGRKANGRWDRQTSLILSGTGAGRHVPRGRPGVHTMATMSPRDGPTPPRRKIGRAS